MLTPEDLAQITAIVAASEQRTGAALAASEERTGAGLAASEARTGAAFAAAEERIVAALATAIHAEIKAAEERGQELTRTVETNLLTAFHGHAKGQTARLHTAESQAHDFAIRLAAIEDRVLNLETRRH